MGVITGEIIPEKLPALITVPPDSNIDGIVLFPQDVQVLTTSTKGTVYHIDTH